MFSEPDNFFLERDEGKMKLLFFRSKIEEDDEAIRKRQALTESKTPIELSQINSFSEIPVPKRIEEWLHHNEQHKV